MAIRSRVDFGVWPFWTEGSLLPSTSVVETVGEYQDRIGEIEVTRKAWDLVLDHKGCGIDPIKSFSVRGPAEMRGSKFVSRGSGSAELTLQLASRNSVVGAVDAVATAVLQGKDFARASLGGVASRAVDKRLTASQAAGIPVATAKKLFTAQNGTASYQRNPQFWAADIDLTGISPFNTGTGYGLGITAISRRHIAGANHAIAAPGSTVVFVTKDSQVVTRTLTSTMQVGDSDIRVGLLNSDLPDSIAHYPVLPADWRNWLPTLGEGMPVMILDAEEFGLVGESLFGDYVSYNSSLVSPRSLFWETLVGGDSGNPVFLIFGNRLVLLTCHHYGYDGESGPNYAQRVAATNSVMTALGGGYQLTHPNLSNVTFYA